MFASDHRNCPENRLLAGKGRKRVALKRTGSELRTLYYTNTLPRGVEDQKGHLVQDSV